MSSLANPFSYSELPNDVGRMVFEYLAEDGILSCATVSKRVQSWDANRVESVIYRQVLLTTTKKGALFHRTVEDIEISTSPTKLKGFLASHVKSLFIQWGVKATLIAPILEACTGVTNLALYIPDTHANPQLWGVTVSDRLAPTYLSLPGSTLPEANRNFLQPIFRNVTHLELLWEDEEDLDLEWESLRSLQNLTHLSVDMQFDPDDTIVEIVKDLLDCCPGSVQLFIFWVIFIAYFDPSDEHFEDIMALQRGEIDPRVVVGHSVPNSGGTDSSAAIGGGVMFLSHADAMAGWDPHSELAKETIWSRAEERIERRTKGLGKGS